MEQHNRLNSLIDNASEFRKDPIIEKGLSEVDSNFALLANQVQYGAVGIYCASADGMQMIKRKSLELTPGLGEKIAAAFINETSLPHDLKKAVEHDQKVSVKTLTEWGQRAHVDHELGKEEGLLLQQAVESDERRRRVIKLLRKYPAMENESELSHLIRIAANASADDADLCFSIMSAVKYEYCYQQCLFVLDRMIFLSRSGGEIYIDDIVNCPEFKQAYKTLSIALSEYLEFTKSINSNRLRDINDFFGRLLRANDVLQMCVVVLDRHREVQNGKFDGGRPKGPWIEVKESKIVLSMMRAGAGKKDIGKPDLMPTHTYRTQTASEFLAGQHLRQVS